MKYNLSHIKHATKGLHDTIQIQAHVLDDQLEQIGLDTSHDLLTLDLVLLPLPSEQVQAKGRLSGHLTFQCQRCLEPAIVSVEQPILFHFFPPGSTLPDQKKQVFDPNEDESQETDPACVYHNRESLDLAPLIREQLILSLPMAFVCKEECLGLCSTCGENRNTTTCTCNASLSKSPFASLREMV